MAKKMKIPGWPESLSPMMPGMASFNPLANHPLVNNPVTNTLSGGLDFMKNLWGGLPASVPGFVVPTVDLEELDKRIKDLKAVESWLEVNAHMLRATIQSLEVQRNTVAAIKAIGGSFGGSADFFKNGKAAEAALASATPGVPTGWPWVAAATDAEPDPKEEAPAPVLTPLPQAVAPTPSVRKVTEKAAAKETTAAAAAPGLSGGAWLGFLQDQFNKVALAALAGSDATAKPAAKKAAAKKVTAKKGAAVVRKPAAKKARAPVRRRR